MMGRGFRDNPNAGTVKADIPALVLTQGEPVEILAHHKALGRVTIKTRGGRILTIDAVYIQRHEEPEQ